MKAPKILSWGSSCMAVLIAWPASAEVTVRAESVTAVEMSNRDVNRIVLASLSLIRQRRDDSSKVEIVEQLGSDLPTAWADFHQIQQVLLNIYLNAVQAMPGGGSLTVKTSYDDHEDNGFVRISVSDTGQGISEDNLGNIFKPFFTTKNRGTGLGLAISRGIVDQHGGRIEINSQNDRGTTALIDIPVEDGRAVQEVASGAEGSG